MINAEPINFGAINSGPPAIFPTVDCAGGTVTGIGSASAAFYTNQVLWVDQTAQSTATANVNVSRPSSLNGVSVSTGSGRVDVYRNTLWAEGIAVSSVITSILNVQLPCAGSAQGQSASTGQSNTTYVNHILGSGQATATANPTIARASSISAAGQSTGHLQPTTTRGFAIAASGFSDASAEVGCLIPLIITGNAVSSATGYSVIQKTAAIEASATGLASAKILINHYPTINAAAVSSGYENFGTFLWVPGQLAKGTPIIIENKNREIVFRAA